MSIRPNFLCTLQEKLCVGSKNDCDTFLMVSTCSIITQILRKIAQCAPAVGAKIWCLYVFIVTLRGRRADRSRRYNLSRFCVADYGSILMPFTAFFQKGLSFQTGQIVLIFVARWCHNFQEIAVKNCEKYKNRRKRLCAPLRIDSSEIFFFKSTALLQSKQRRCAPI